MTLDIDQAITRGVNKALNTPIDNLGGRSVCDLLREWHSGRIVAVVRCKDCKRCRLLKEVPGFACAKHEMVFYAPYYSAETYFCADGEPREPQKDVT